MVGSYEKEAFLWWNIIDHDEGVWSLWDGLGFCHYYYLQHRIFKKWHILICDGYRPEDHPKYKEFSDKHLKNKLSK